MKFTSFAIVVASVEAGKNTTLSPTMAVPRETYAPIATPVTPFPTEDTIVTPPPAVSTPPPVNVPVSSSSWERTSLPSLYDDDDDLWRLTLCVSAS